MERAELIHTAVALTRQSRVACSRGGLFIYRRCGTLRAALNDSDSEQSHNQNDRPSKKGDGSVPRPIPRADRAVATRHRSDDWQPTHNDRDNPGSEAPPRKVGHTGGGCDYLEYRPERDADAADVA
jgi:hypothetical protein